MAFAHGAPVSLQLPPRDFHRIGSFSAGTFGHVLMLCRGFKHVVLSIKGGGNPILGTEDGAFPYDSYLGEVTSSEKVEEPPQYVPPPPISEQEICTQEKVESLLYTLERILPGPLDGDKVQALCSMLCATVECENPVACFRGSDKCSEWLRALLHVQGSINLHELYYENDVEDPDKRRIYAVWTLSFLEQGSGPNQMSGETIFEMEKSGLVSRISSTWYVLQEGGASFTRAKESLYHLLQKTF